MFAGERDGHDCCDCTIYLVDALCLLRDDFTSTLEPLAPDQTLSSSAVIVNAERDGSSEMDRMARFIQSLGVFDGTPPPTVPTG